MAIAAVFQSPDQLVAVRRPLEQSGEQQLANAEPASTSSPAMVRLGMVTSQRGLLAKILLSIGKLYRQYVVTAAGALAIVYDSERPPGESEMPRKVRIVTTSGFDAEGSDSESNRRQAFRYVEAAGRQGADLVCLPETFFAPGGLAGAEPIPGPTFDRLAELAAAYGLWVVAGFCVVGQDGREGVENSAIVIDRAGRLAARYVKVHPTIGECEERGIVPGRQATVVDTDFGRMGLAICYDIDWPDYWDDLARQGAELVVWPSAYDGGFPLRVYAALHRYYVVSAVQSAHGKVIDLTGRVISSTGDWHPTVSATIDLDKELFHADTNERKLPELESDLGDRVTVEAYAEERYFTLESHDPAWPVGRIKERYGLENLDDYLARAQLVQEEHRGSLTPAARRGI